MKVSDRAISKAYAALPSYQELADLVVELAEVNISGLSGEVHPRVMCFSYGPKMPAHWQRAIDARKALLDQRVAQQRRSTRVSPRHASREEPSWSYGYDEIGVAVAQTLAARRAKHSCWKIVDLGDGDIVTFVWFGTLAKMTQLRRSLESAPKIDLIFKARLADSTEVEKALRKAIGQKAGRKTPTKSAAHRLTKRGS